jgi:hypothetical protein
MSLSAVFYLISVIGAYKLGVIMCRDPETVSRWCKTVWGWMNK